MALDRIVEVAVVEAYPLSQLLQIHIAMVPAVSGVAANREAVSIFDESADRVDYDRAIGLRHRRAWL